MIRVLHPSTYMRPRIVDEVERSVQYGTSFLLAVFKWPAGGGDVGQAWPHISRSLLRPADVAGDIGEGTIALLLIDGDDRTASSEKQLICRTLGIDGREAHVLDFPQDRASVETLLPFVETYLAEHEKIVDRIRAAADARKPH